MSIFLKRHSKLITKTLSVSAFILVFGFLNAGSYKTASAAVTTLNFSGFESGAATKATGSDISPAGTGIFSTVTTPVYSGTYAGKIDSGASQTEMMGWASWVSALDKYDTVKIDVNFSAFPATAETRVILFMGGGVGIASIGITPTGKLQLRDGTGAQVGSDSSTLSVGVWYRIELQIKVSTAVSDYMEGKLDGVTFASGTNTNLGNNPTQWVEIGWSTRFTSPGANKVMYLDDIVAISDTLPTFPGETGVINLKPNALGTTNTFPTQIGTFTNRWDGVSEIPPSVLQGWSQTATALVREQFNVEDLTAIAVDRVINAVKPWALALTSAASSVAAIILRENGVNFDTAISTITTADVYKTIYDIPPSSGGYWAKVKLDSLESGLKSTGTTADTKLYDNGIMVLYSPPTVPVLTSPTVTSITSTGATLGANVTGGGAFTARGTCWGTTASPTTNCLAEGGTTQGIFTHARTGMSAGTTIFYRGYATNSVGTAYSPDGSFTPAPPATYTIKPWAADGVDTYFGSIYSAGPNDTAISMSYGGWADFYYDYFKFDITNGPAAANTTEARLWVYSNITPVAQPLINLDYITEAWDQTTLTRTLNPASTLFAAGPAPIAAGWNSSTFTSIYQDWKNGVKTNYGVKYTPTANNNTGGGFVSADDPDPTNHPRLVLTSNSGVAVRTDSITPYTSGNDASIVITSIAGVNFAAGATVKLQKTGETDIICTGFTFTSSTSLTNGSCPVTDAAPGMWNLIVTNTDASTGTLAPAFQVTAPLPPTVVTGSASNVTPIAATLSSTVNPNAVSTTSWFRISTTNPVTCNDTFGNRVPVSGGNSLGSGSLVVPDSQIFTGLNPSTTYYYCAIASNSMGTSYGSPSSFSTIAIPSARLTYRVYVANNILGGTSLDGNVPPGTVNGDMLIAFLTHETSTATLTTVPSGWNLVGHPTSSAGVSFYVYSHIAGASEPAFYTWGWDTTTSAAKNALINTFAIYPTDTVGTTAIDATTVTTISSASGTHTLNAITTTVANDLVVGGWVSAAQSTYTIPAGMDTPGYFGLPAFTHIGATAVQASAGSSGTKSSTTANSIGGGVLTSVKYTAAPAPTVTSINPTSGADSVSITTVSGTNFASGAFVKLTKSSNDDIICTGFTLTNSTTLSGGTCDLTGEATGSWNVVVTNLDYQAATLTNGFTNSSTPPLVPTITTPTVTAITSTGATLGANVTSDGGATLTARGTCWATTPAPLTNCVAEGGTTAGVFTHERTDMAVSTIYYYRGYATNSAGTAYSADGSFTTLAVSLPTVTTPTVTSITTTGGTLGANVTSDGGAAITARGTCWATTANPVTNCVAEGGTTTGIFAQARSGMVASTIYYYRGYATNSAGTGYSPDGSFTTLGTTIYQTPGAVAYSAVAGTTVTPAYPASIAANNLLVLIIGMKPSTANGGSVTTPAGWTAVPNGTLVGAGGYATTLGTDTGNTNVFSYYKVATGSESGTLTVTIATSNITWAQMYRFSAGSGSTWDVVGTTGSDIVGDATVSIAMASDPDVTALDYILGAMVIPTDVTTPAQFSAEALSQTGITFGTVTEISEPDSSLGNQIGGVTYQASVNSGTASVAPTFTATAGGTKTNVRGPGVFVRVREVTPTLPIAVSATGTQTVNMSIPSAGNYVGGAFSFIKGSGSTNVSQITVSETGTVNATTNLSNLSLVYKQEASCSATIPAGTTSFGSAQSFNGSQKATFSAGWGINGMVNYDSGGTQIDISKGIAIDSSSNIYVAGYQATNGNDWVVRKYTSAGVLDTTWGSGTGMVNYNSGAAQNDAAYAITIDSSNNIYVAGYQTTTANGADMVVRKYTSAGVLDTTWGSGTGMVTYNSGGVQNETAQAITIDSTNAIYVTGWQATNVNDWFARKYTSAGVLDTTWGSGTGMVTYNSGGAGSNDDVAYGITIDSDKAIYVTGYQTTTANGADMVVRKYTSAGVLDTTWGSGTGMVTYNSGSTQADEGHAITIDSSKNIYVGGYQTTNGFDWFARKYTSAGVLDTTWGSGTGMVTYNSGAVQNDTVMAINIDSTNAIYVGGYKTTSGGDWAVRKYTSAGVLDTSWGSGTGMVSYNSGGVQDDVPYGIAIDSSNNIYVAGYQRTSGANYDFAVRKYDNTGALAAGMLVGASQMCVYATVDVGSGTVDGNSLELEISNPSTEVTVATGTVLPATPVAITGFTNLGTALAAPTVTSPTVSLITSTGATLGANVTSNGGATLTARGTCWATTANPVTNCLAEGSTTTGVFTHARTGMPSGTLIFYRGYATNSVGTSYSGDGSFSTTAEAVVPTLTSPTHTSVTSTGATLGANLTADGGAAITARGTCWATTANPVINCVAEGATTTGVFTHARTGMPSGTTIFYRGYATNSVGTGYSADGSFTTLSVSLPTVTDSTVAGITSTGATLGANVTSDGGGVLTARGTCWATTANPVTNCLAEGSTTTGVFTHARTGLPTPAGTLVYYRGYATNSAGTGYSSDGTFITALSSPTTTLTSVVLDTLVAKPAYNSILWKGTLPSGTKVRFRVAASTVSTGPWTDSDFIGSNGTSCGSAFWYEPSTPNLPIQMGCQSNLNSKRYFKYKVQLCSATDCVAQGTQTPIITDIIVNWSP